MVSPAFVKKMSGARADEDEEAGGILKKLKV